MAKGEEEDKGEEMKVQEDMRCTITIDYQGKVIAGRIFWEMKERPVAACGRVVRVWDGHITCWLTAMTRIVLIMKTYDEP